MRVALTLLAVMAALLAAPATAQLGLPGVGLPQVPPVAVPDLPVGRAIDEVTGSAGRTAGRLLDLRAERIDRLLRRNRGTIELDATGAPARRGELLLIDPSPSALAAAQAAGFAPAGREQLGSLGLSVVRLALPRGVSLAEGEARLRRAAPGAEVAADNLHFQSGGPPLPVLAEAARAAAAPIATPVGIIDGAPRQAVAALRGFAEGAPLASHHGSAVVSLLEGAGARNLRVADIYGSDPAGGNALALIRALDWLIGGGAQVVSISLGGPNNLAVGKAIAAAQRKGVVVVAAVGNDGPAAPPAYPASYPGVVAVTGTDGRGRVLIEAGRALHLDYAAPAADILARNKAGKWSRVRGTSYAVPLVAARAAAALGGGGSWRATLDREAEDLGPRGPDASYGRGLLCRACARQR
ncbi:MAG TPA: S8 family serine peptidase [Croceibacterium sp.]|nr:S8 family serine peptidase [Croceibacterium sp.]